MGTDLEHFLKCSQQIFTCSKSTVETLELGLKYVQILNALQGLQFCRSGVFIVVNFKYTPLLMLILDK